MASFIRDSIIGQCLRPILNYPSWLQYADNAIPIPELNHENQGYENEKPILVSWQPNDPENPHHWPSFKKAFVAFVIGIYSFVVYMSAPIYTPGVEAFRDEFGVNAAEGSLGLALYVYVLSLSLSLIHINTNKKTDWVTVLARSSSAQLAKSPKSAVTCRTWSPSRYSA